MQDVDVLIIGAGLTGLRAAEELTTAGVSVLVIEKGAKVGGRTQSTTIDGYTLDHGFQVLLSGYPEVRRYLAGPRIASASFLSGARVRYKNRFIDFMDPVRHPEGILSTLTSPLASIADLWRLFTFTGPWSPSHVVPRGISTKEGLVRIGFSETFQNGFLKPFLRGVLLDPSLALDLGVARFYLTMFARGDALLPAGGAGALAEELAMRVGRSHIRLEASVHELTSSQVVLESGESFSARMVLCCTDALAASALGSPEQTVPHLGTTTLYFTTNEPPFSEPIIVLSAEDGPITTLSVLTNVQPSYAPAGHHLISVSVIGSRAQQPDELLAREVQDQLTQWYGPTVHTWRLLKRISVPAALTARPRLSEGWFEHNGILFAGDYLSYPSQNGALLAGRVVGEEIIRRLLD